MIIIQLNGGLGNQLYQYAIAKKLAIKNNTKLKIDLVKYGAYKAQIEGLSNPYMYSKPSLPQSINNQIGSTLISSVLNKLALLKKQYYSLIDSTYYHEDTKRYYSLYSFNISGKVLNFFDFALYRIIKRLFFYKIIIYPKERFNQQILAAGKNSYLIGYFQSFKYFQDIRNILLKEFKVTIDPNNYNKDMLNKILNCNSVSLHVRRGDYISESTINQTHGTCSPKYYEDTINYIKLKVENPTFFIFSDDINWAKDNIKTDCETYFSENTVDQDYEDLRLMYSCKHFIIANSTFSWWGAWLSENPTKIVCAPSKWFNDPSKDYDINEIIPENWIRF